jgi:hypothetical protein
MSNSLIVDNDGLIVSALGEKSTHEVVMNLRIHLRSRLSNVIASLPGSSIHALPIEFAGPRKSLRKWIQD